jgi:hypothetical protein
LEEKNKNFLKTNTRKWEIYKIAQENVLMQKRLAETRSCFNPNDDRNIKTGEKKRAVTQEKTVYSERLGSTGFQSEEPRSMVFKKLGYMNKLGLYEVQIYIEGNK